MILKGGTKIIYGAKNVSRIYKGSALVWQQVAELVKGMLVYGDGSKPSTYLLDPAQSYRFTKNDTSTLYTEATLPSLKPNTLYSYRCLYKVPNGVLTPIKVFHNGTQVTTATVDGSMYDQIGNVADDDRNHFLRFTFFSGTTLTNKIKISTGTLPIGAQFNIGFHEIQETSIYGKNLGG